MKDLIQQARADPGKLNFGAGTLTTRLAGELFKSLTGVDMVVVPYKGSAGTTHGPLCNEVTFTLDGVPTSMPHIRSGKFRVLANLSQRPIAALPDVPVLAREPGLARFDVSVWLGLPEVKDKLALIGLDAGGTGPAEFSAFIRAESERWSKVIRDAGFRVE